MLKMLSAGAVVLLIAISVLYGLSGVTKVDPGYVALQIKMIGLNRGEITTLPLGYRWIEPFSNDVEQYDTRERQQEELKGMAAGTADGQPILVDISLQTSLMPDKVAELHTRVGRDYYQKLVYPAMRSIIRSATGGVLSDHIYTEQGRLTVQNAVEKKLNERFNEFGVVAVVNLRDIKFSNDEFVRTLEHKAQAAQQIEIETRNAAAEEQRAIKVANAARGERDKIILNAEGEKRKQQLEGEGIRLRREAEAAGNLALAKAEAEGLRLRNEALGSGDNVVRMEWARNLGPNVKVMGYPLGAPGTTSLFNVDGVLGDALKIKGAQDISK